MYYELKACLLPISQLSLLIAYDIDYPDGDSLSKIPELRKHIEYLNSLDPRSIFSKEANEAYEPVRQYFCNRLTDDLLQGRVSALTTGLNLDGSINPDRTYITDTELLNWYSLYGLEPGLVLDEMYWPLSEQIDNRVSRLLEHKQHQLMLDFSGSDYIPELPDDERLKESWDALTRENAYLRSLIDSDKITSPIPNKKPDRRSTRHSSNREEILGAALACLAAWPNECRSKSGEAQPEAGEAQPEAGEAQPEAGEAQPEAGEAQPEAGEVQPEAGRCQGTKLAKLIEDKALLFWPETGAPPLALSGMPDLLNDWIKKLESKITPRAVIFTQHFLQLAILHNHLVTKTYEV